MLAEEIERNCDNYGIETQEQHLPHNIRKRDHRPVETLTEAEPRITRQVRHSSRKEKRMYFRSESTGQVYKLNFVPRGVGWQLATEAEYIAWCKAAGIEPAK